VLGADGPRVVHSGVTPPYGRVTAAADVSAWALTILSAVSGSLGHVSADSRRADLSLLPPPLRQIVRASLSTDPAARPTAQAIAALLLDPAPRPAGALALSAPTGAHSADRRAASGRAAGTPARHAPSGRTGPGGQATGRPGRRRITARAAAAVIAVAALAGGGAVLLSRSAATGPLSTGASQPAGRPAAARPSATVPSAARLSSPATTPAVTTAPPAVRVPGSLSGTWTGRVRQANPPLSFTVRIKLTAGTVAGTVSYPSLACSGVLTLTGQAGRGYVFHQGIVAGQQTCGPGIVTLTGHGARLGFFFIPAPPGGPAVRGTLSR
jgi:hypothetical protein